MSSGIEQESELAAARRINQYLTMSLNSRRKNRLCEKNRELTGAARLRGIVGRQASYCLYHFHAEVVRTGTACRFPENPAD